MPSFTPDENFPLLIEITPTPGAPEAVFSTRELAANADDVMTKVMNAIHHVSELFSGLYANLPGEYTQVELGFGVTITSEMGALIAKAGLESTFNVNLVWRRQA